MDNLDTWLNLVKSIKTKNYDYTLERAKKIFSFIDLTDLNEGHGKTEIATLCQKAQGALGHVAAVCVYPQFVKQVSAALQNTAIKTATVVNFPYGTDSLEDVQEVIKSSMQEGAEEIDVVFPYKTYFAGEKTKACDLIAACKHMCGHTVLLKVILETGAIGDLQNIAKVSQDVIQAGADFLKTSTGKIEPGATLEAAGVMLAVIQTTDRPIGLKVSGGIKNYQSALQYMELANEMGEEWLTPARFRLGASQLVDSLQF